MLDLGQLTSAIDAHGRVARVVVAAVDGSSPREVGAAMLVWATGQSGTIGGGALEWQAVQAARAMLAGAEEGSDGMTRRLERIPLGPALGQCCGGAVSLLSEVFVRAPEVSAGTFARPISSDAREMPLSVRRMLAQARGQGQPPAPSLVQGWFVEPVALPARHLWLWGAGHVGRAIAGVLAPLPDLAITWVDVAADRFPDNVPEGVTVVPAADPAALVPHAPKDAEHLILTFSHALDLGLCHALLTHGFARCGLIGSATKRARFRSRLAALGHAPQAIDRIECPIGDPALGKHPQAIAIGVAADLLRHGKASLSLRENAG